MLSHVKVFFCFCLDLPTEREMDLWAELQATKDTLRITEEEMATYKMEKIRFLESLTKIAVNINVYKSLEFKLFHELFYFHLLFSGLFRDIAKAYHCKTYRIYYFKQNK